MVRAEQRSIGEVDTTRIGLVTARRRDLSASRFHQKEQIARSGFGAIPTDTKSTCGVESESFCLATGVSQSLEMRNQDVSLPGEISASILIA